MQSICTFKSTVLGDPRILMIGATAREESIGERKQSLDSIPDENETILSQYNRIDSETRSSYNSLA